MFRNRDIYVETNFLLLLLSCLLTHGAKTRYIGLIPSSGNSTIFFKFEYLHSVWTSIRNVNLLTISFPMGFVAQIASSTKLYMKNNFSKTILRSYTKSNHLINVNISYHTCFYKYIIRKYVIRVEVQTQNYKMETFK